MMFIIGFLIYWFSTTGYYLFLVRKFNVKREFVFAIWASLLIIVLFIGSILNMLVLFNLLVYLGGILSYFYLIKHKLLDKTFLKSFFDYKYFLFIILSIYFTIVCSNLHLLHYDNFSHWGLIIKQLFTHNTLGSFKFNVDIFTSYPPGSALFSYYFGFFSPRTESIMLIGHAYLNLAFMASIMALFNEKRKVLSSILFIVLVLFFSVVNIKLNELLVDTTLGLIGITTFIYLFVYHKDYKKCFYGLTLFSVLFILIKNSGIVFIALNSILLLLIIKYNKVGKKGFKYLIYMLLIVGGIFLVWKNHLAMVYPSDDGYTSNHSISINNVGRNILKKGPSRILEIVNIYVNNVFNINNVINHYLIIINIIMILLFIIMKEKRKVILKAILSINALAILYYISLGVMYIVSMPYDEALYLAGFKRYMLTLIITVMGILIITIYHNLNYNYKFNNCINYVFILFLGLIIFNKDYKCLLGIDDYENSNIKDVYEISEKINLKEYQNYKKIFYLTNKNGSCSFYEFALKYTYFDSNIKTMCNDVNVDKLNKNEILILESLDSYKDEFNKLKKINDNLYWIKEDLEK